MKVEFVEREADQPSRCVTAHFSFSDLDFAIAATKAGKLDADRLRSAAVDMGFSGDKASAASFPMSGDLGGGRQIVVGLGPRDKMDFMAIEDGGAQAWRALGEASADTLALRLEAFSPEEAAHAALGVLLAAYAFRKYRTAKEAKRPTTLHIVTAEPDAARAAFAPLAALAEGIAFARDLANEPPNILFPTEFAARMQALETQGLEVTVLGEAEMADRGMGALLGVGQGSARESQLVVCEWRGAPENKDRPIVFVGKGVTFDSGGLSIKTAKDMEGMKLDMGGAAAVAGAMLTLALRRARANVVGILGLVENMPDGAALRPGDILTTLSGQTVEVVNTDAEGRLVLADALWYAQREFHPAALVDLATLTGHVSYALGNDYAALLSNDDGLARRLLDAGTEEGEQLWRLPLVQAYDKLHDTPVADMKNVGGHPEAGTITAALFLQRFVNKTPWAHLDIESVATRNRDDRPTLPKGATGYGVRTLNRLVANHYEEGQSA